MTNLDFQTETFTIDCDQCGRSEDYEGSECWEWGWDQAKENGWISRKIDGEWYHFCNTFCLYNYQKKQVGL